MPRRTSVLLLVPIAYASHFDELVQARNLVSSDQLIESTPPPPNRKENYLKDKDGAEFLNTRLGRVLSEAGNLGLDASIVKPAEAAVKSSSKPEPALVLQQLLALMQNASSAQSAPQLKSENESVQQPSLPIPPLVIPSIAPIEVPSAVSVYNQALEKIQEAAERWNLPSINSFNATLPEIDSIGSGAGLPDVMEIVGQNLGSSMGASAGNIAAGTTSLLATYAKSLKDGFVSVLSNFGGASRRRLDDDDDDDKDDEEKNEKKKKKAKEGSDHKDQAPSAAAHEADGSSNRLYDSPSSPYDPESSYYGDFHMPPVSYPPPSLLFPAPYPQFGQQAFGWGDVESEWMDHFGDQQNLADFGQIAGQGNYFPGNGFYPGYETYLPHDALYPQDSWEGARRLLSASHLQDDHALLGSRRQLLSSMTPFAFSLSDLQNKDRLQSALNATLPTSLFSSLALTNYLFNNPFFNSQLLMPLTSLSPTTAPTSQSAAQSSLSESAGPSSVLGGATTATPSSVLGGANSLSPSSALGAATSLTPSSMLGGAASASQSPLLGSSASLPEVPSVPVASQAIGSGVGDTLGSTLGGLVGGLTSLVGSTASSATAGFLQGALPAESTWLSRVNMSDLSRRLLSAKGRGLETDDSALREGVSCAVGESAFSSSRVMTFTNVESLRVCQLICQTYSDPLVIYNCSETSSLGDICLAISYSQVTGRCDLHFALDAEYEIEGFDAAPVVCPGTTFVQPASQIEAILNANGNGSSCLTAQAVTIQRVQETAKPTPAALAVAPTIPEVPAFHNENAAADSMWRYNPDTPNASDFRIDLIYQAQQVAQPPPAGKAYWGSLTDIVDWRHCALLCASDADCKFWTYLFDAATYQEAKAGCRLATNADPTARTVPGGPRAISGPRMDHFPLDLFGSALNKTTSARRLFADPTSQKWRSSSQPPVRLEESPLLPSIIDERLLSSLTGRQLQEKPAARSSNRVPCEEWGFVYHSAHSSLTRATSIPTNLFSLTALTADKCRAACARTPGCKGFQLVPVATLAASTRLQGSQRSSCLLLSQISHKISADPMIISGVISTSDDGLCSLSDLPLSTAIIGHSLNEIVEAVTGPLDEYDRGSEEELEGEVASPASSRADTGCISPEGYSRQFDRDISYRGALVASEANVISGVANAAECWRECSSVEACQAFSWGPWKGCYLLATVETMLVADAGVVSGYKECELNEAEEYETLKRRLQAIGGERDVSTCGRATRGRVYNEGALLANLTELNLTENQCFHKCRATEDCYFMTYFNTQQANRRLQLATRPTIVRRLQETPDMADEINLPLPDSTSSAPLQPDPTPSPAAPLLPDPTPIPSQVSAPTPAAVVDHLADAITSNVPLGEVGSSSAAVESGPASSAEEGTAINPVSGVIDPVSGVIDPVSVSPSPTPVASSGGESPVSLVEDVETGPVEATCLLWERVGQMVNVEAGLGVSAEANCDVLGDLIFAEPSGRGMGARQMMLPTLVVVASGGLIFVAAALYIGVRERRRHQKASLIRNLEISSPGSSLTPSSFNFNAFGMKSPRRAPGSPDRLERGSPAAKVRDFEAVEPKSTGKRLKKTF